MKTLYVLCLFLVPYIGFAQTANDYINKGVEAHNQQNFKTAISHYSKAIEIDPKAVLAYSNRATAYYSAKSYQQALADCDKLLTLDANNYTAHYVAGVIYKTQNDYTKAIDFLTKAIAAKPEDANTRYNRAWAYWESLDHKNGLIDMKKLAEIAPDEAEYHYWCGKWKHEVSEEEYKTAIKDYNKAIALNDKYVEAYVERGAYYMTEGNFKLALKDFTAAKKIDPNVEVDHYIEAAQFELEMQEGN